MTDWWYYGQVRWESRLHRGNGYFIASVGKVHANDVETTFTKLIDLLDGVCLGTWVMNKQQSLRSSVRLTNSADDGGAAIVLGWLILCVELGEPLNSRATGTQMV